MIQHGVARYGAAAPPVNANVGPKNEHDNRVDCWRFLPATGGGSAGANTQHNSEALANAGQGELV
jgi:hypothetical protein